MTKEYYQSTLDLLRQSAERGNQVAAVVLHDLEHGAAPSLGTNQTIRELCDIA